MTDITPSQRQALEDIAAGRYDDCTVTLPPGLVCLDRDRPLGSSHGSPIVLTDLGREVLSTSGVE